MSKTIYIDVCALSRPYDEQHYLRIKLETEAVNLILSRIKSGKYTMIYSPVHIMEIDAIPDAMERIELLSLLQDSGRPVKAVATKTKKRAEKLYIAGLGVADAAHIAYAEQANAEFISCDDALIKKYHGYGASIWCGNPVAFCEKEGLK
ncbi:MAG: hypothetical protein A3J24_06225 [Deltaproteobacteria bacterium RIFCSPLOWO2_02_FULL_53_8]|nr:MAG: hypothetical protein A3J24_06225 [Deltaproteobacteria bacterium RIFCSPLOWO2_02_FULL_53_8]